MSVIVQSGQAISQSPLNHSRAKQQFSFPKAERFRQASPIMWVLFKYYTSRNQKISYDLPSLFSKRATSIGFGRRTVMQMSSKTGNVHEFRWSARAWLCWDKRNLRSQQPQIESLQLRAFERALQEGLHKRESSRRWLSARSRIVLNSYRNR